MASRCSCYLFYFLEYYIALGNENKTIIYYSYR
nr:MAG TPA: hypothetical protein [Caudoviricetes sp.]